MAGSHRGPRRLLRAFAHTGLGLRAAWRHEAAFRQEIVLAIVLTPVALWLGETAVERVILIASLILVLIIELLNTGLEAVVDRIGPERHELSGRAKDMGSAAVFLACLNALLTWLLVLIY